MPSEPPVREGFVPFRGFRTWYRVVGDLEQVAHGTLPLLTLHGGPGAAHDYLESLTPFAETGRPVIFYDRRGTCWQPSVKDFTIMVNSTFNGARMEDVWLDK